MAIDRLAMEPTAWLSLTTAIYRGTCEIHIFECDIVRTDGLPATQGPGRYHNGSPNLNVDR